MAETEGRLTRSSPTNDKLAPKNANASLTSSYKSTIKDDIHMSSTTTTSLTAAFGFVHDNYASAAPSNTPTITIKNYVVAPTTNKTSSSTFEHDGLVPTTTITTAATTPASDSSFPLHRLPRELQDHIHTYISFNAATWIGTPPLATKEQDIVVVVVVVERNNMHKPATFIKTHSNIVLVSKQIRDDFRTAVLRTYMESRRQVEFLLYDFDSKPIREFFAACSTLELQTLQKRRSALFKSTSPRTFGAFAHRPSSVCVA